MNTRFYTPLSLSLAAIVAMACSYAGAQAAPENMRLVSADALLIQNINSKNAAQGQVIMAKLTSNVKEPGQTELPKGTLLVGQVEEADPSNSGGPSKLSIVFNQARLSDGRTIPIKATLLSAYPANEGYGESAPPPEVVLANVIPDHESVDQEPGMLGGNVAMHGAVKENVSAVFTSKDHNINLKRGTQFQIAIAPESAQSQGTANGQD